MPLLKSVRAYHTYVTRSSRSPCLFRLLAIPRLQTCPTYDACQTCPTCCGKKYVASVAFTATPPPLNLAVLVDAFLVAPSEQHWGSTQCPELSSKRHTNMPTPAHARVLSQSALAASDLCRQSGSSAVHRGRMQTLQQAAYIKMHVHVKRRRCSQFPIIIMLEHLACQLGVHRAWLLAETRPMTLYTWSRALGASETTSKSPR